MPGRARRMPVCDITEAELSGPRAASVLAELREAAPVSWVPALDGWLVTSHALAVTVMRDAATFTVQDPRFSTAQVVGASMLSLDGVDHRRHRAPFGPPFRPAQVETRFASAVTEVASELVKSIRPDGRADLRATVAGPLAVLVIAEALGLDEVDADTVLGWYAAIVAAVSAITGGAAVDAASEVAIGELGAAVRHSLHTGGSALLTAARETLTEAEIVSNAAVMMFGGIETTEAMICNALVQLLEDPAVLAAVRADPSLVRVAVEESLRLEPAAAFVDRYATCPVRLGDASIAQGDLVRVSLTAANRDPAVFDEPDRYDPSRGELGSQLSFARGPHVCIAMDLARLETDIAVRLLFERLPGLRLDGPAPATGLVFRKPAAVMTSWDTPGGTNGSSCASESR